MHVHTGHSLLAILLAFCSGFVVYANAAKQLRQVVRYAFKSYRQLRERLGYARKRVGPPSRGITARIRHQSPPNRALPPALGGDGCGYLCCTSGSFGRFYGQTYAPVIAAIHHIRGSGTPAGKVEESIDDIYRGIHRVWLLEYSNLNEACRRAALWRLVIIDTLRYRRCRHRIAVMLSHHLDVDKVGQIRTRRPNRLSVKRADNIMSEVISDVISELSPKQCTVFIYGLFAKVPEKEIAKRLRLTIATVDAYSAKSSGPASTPRLS
jgi:hypothetical protein